MNAGAYAQKYLEDLLSFFGLNTVVEVADVEDMLELRVPSTHLNGFLIGKNGENLRAIQYLLNMTLRARGYEDTAVSVDVAGYKRQKREHLQHTTEKIVEQVRSSGQPYTFEPMSSYERRVVHQVVNDSQGVVSESAGEGRDRHVVIKSDGQAAAAKTETSEEE